MSRNEQWFGQYITASSGGGKCSAPSTRTPAPNSVMVIRAQSETVKSLARRRVLSKNAPMNQADSTNGYKVRTVKVAMTEKKVPHKTRLKALVFGACMSRTAAPDASIFLSVLPADVNGTSAGIVGAAYIWVMREARSRLPNDRDATWLPMRLFMIRLEGCPACPTCQPAEGLNVRNNFASTFDGLGAAP
mmetsp:Transcript_72586/g.132671  ORF Transcript_72586/g.132671 Transcript_72586/m.132671 type:complete len:190 (+) Transcript_72586:528-1097(+)